MPGGKPKPTNKPTSAVATAATTDSKAQEQQLVTDELPTSINDWNTDHITIWLKNIDLTEYTEIFKTQALQGEDIISITSDQLKSIGIDKLGHRNRIIREAQKWEKNTHNLPEEENKFVNNEETILITENHVDEQKQLSVTDEINDVEKKQSIQTIQNTISANKSLK